MSKRYRTNGPVDYSDMTLSADELWSCYDKRLSDRTEDIVSHPNFPIHRLVGKGPRRAGSWYVVYNPSIALFLLSGPEAGSDTFISGLCASFVRAAVIRTGMSPAGLRNGQIPRLDYLHEQADRRYWGSDIDSSYHDCKSCIETAIALHQYEVDRTGDLKPLTLDPKAIGWVKHCLEEYAPRAVARLKRNNLYPVVLEQARFSPNRRRR